MRVERRIFMTPCELEKSERNTTLVEKYKAMKAKYPEIPKSRILAYMHEKGETGGMSISRCYQILKLFNL